MGQDGEVRLADALGRSTLASAVVGRLTPASIAAAVAGLSALAVYIPSLARSITSGYNTGDSGELASAAYSLGISHPTGSPLYTLLGFAVTHLSTAEPALALNTLSAVMADCALCGIAYLIGRCSLIVNDSESAWVVVPSAVIACTSLALSTTFWTQAVVAETRSLAVALDTIVLMLLVPPHLSRRRALSAALVYGLSLSAHLLALFLAPTVVLLILPWARSRIGRWLHVLVCLGLGLSCYIYLPVRAAMHPAANWGNPDTLARFWWVVSGREYRYEMLTLGPGDVISRLGDELHTIIVQLNPLTAAMAVVGLVVLMRRRPLVASALALTFALDLIGSSEYQADAAPTYLMLGMLCVCFFAGIGWVAIAHQAVRFVAPRNVVMAACIALAVIAERDPALDAHSAVAWLGGTTVRDSGVDALQALPQRAIVDAQGDANSVPLWYAQRALGMRKDVTIVASDLLTFAWYYRQVRSQPAFDPRLMRPSDASSDDGTDIALVQERTPLIVLAARPGYPVFSVLPEPLWAALCHEQRVGPVYRCVRATLAR